MLTEQQIQELQDANLKLEAEKTALLKENELLETNQRNQNTYITKLEKERVQVTNAQVNNPAKGISANPTSTLDPKLAILSNYAEKSFIQEAVKEAEIEIIKSVGQNVFDALKDEFKAFLDKNLKVENAQLSYVLSAFNIVYGRAMMVANHPVKAVLLSQQAQPNQLNKTQPQADSKKIMANRIGTMTNEDQAVPGVLGNPNNQAPADKPKNTRQAWERRFGK